MNLFIKKPEHLCWAYERSTQEYMAIKQDLAEPDPLRLAFRDLIKQVIHDVVIKHDQAPLLIINTALQQPVIESDRENVKALIIGELRRLHEGVLARYGLLPSEFTKWKSRQDKH